MFDGFPVWPAVGYGTGWVLFASLSIWIVRRIITGDLVPRQQHLDKIAESEHWRESADKSQAAQHELGIGVHDLVRAVDRLISLGEASNHALTEIQRVAADRETRE